jgi:hypothetical protein
MSYLPWVLAFFAFLTFVFVVGKPKWDAYVKMARLRPDERILHEEKKVSIRTYAWAAFPWYNWTFAGGGPDEYGWLRADVTITNERILVFWKGVPCSIVDFTRQETLPRSWLGWRKSYLMNVTKSDIRVTQDKSGKPCLEVVYAPRKGHGIRTRYYLREWEVARACFVDT